MRLLVHIEFRARVLLILTLLGLTALDASLCRGADGHFSIEMGVRPCLPSDAAAVPTPDPLDGTETTLLDSASGGATCEHTPLFHGTLISQINLAAGCIGQMIPVACTIAARSADPATDSSFCTGFTLCRLRSTTLLI